MWPVNMTGKMKGSDRSTGHYFEPWILNQRQGKKLLDERTTKPGVPYFVKETWLGELCLPVIEAQYGLQLLFTCRLCIKKRKKRKQTIMIIIIRRNKKYRRKGRKHFCQNFNYFRNTLSFQLAACFFQSMPTCMWNSIHRTLPVKRIEQGGHKVIIKLHQTWISRDHNNYVLVITLLWQNFRYNRWEAINNDNFFDKTCRGYGCHLCKY